MGQLIPGERVLWRGRPAWRAVMRDVLHVRIMMGYFAVILLWGFANDRADGWGPLDTLWRGVPVLTITLALFGACALFAWAICRTTIYELTTERCVLHYGVALTANLSIPLRRIATIGVHAHGDGTGDILLAPKPGARLRYVKLWPHARPWRWSRAEPMLRGVADAIGIGQAISEAVADVSPGVFHAPPGNAVRPSVAVPEPTWSATAE